MGEVEAKAAGKEETVGGYKVKVNFSPVSKDERKARKQAISKAILESMKKWDDGKEHSKATN